MHIKASNELLDLINKDIEKDQQKLRKCIKNSKYGISLSEKVNMQRYEKYLNKTISYKVKILFEIENDIFNQRERIKN
jgi:hypothetical protein